MDSRSSSPSDSATLSDGGKRHEMGHPLSCESLVIHELNFITEPTSY